MPKKKRTVEEQTIDPAAQEMLVRAEELGIGTAFSRADDMSPCNIGSPGMCCKLCGMGPCRLTKEGQTGVCGATIDTIQARNLIRAIAAGAAAHSPGWWRCSDHRPQGDRPPCRRPPSGGRSR